jgi:hypothetical protein
MRKDTNTFDFIMVRGYYLNNENDLIIYRKKLAKDLKVCKDDILILGVLKLEED